MSPRHRPPMWTGPRAYIYPPGGWRAAFGPPAPRPHATPTATRGTRRGSGGAAAGHRGAAGQRLGGRWHCAILRPLVGRAPPAVFKNTGVGSWTLPAPRARACMHAHGYAMHIHTHMHTQASHLQESPRARRPCAGTFARAAPSLACSAAGTRFQRARTRMRAGMATASRRIASVLVCSCMLRCVQCVCAQNGAKSNVRSMLWLLVRCVRVRWAARDLRVASRARARENAAGPACSGLASERGRSEPWWPWAALGLPRGFFQTSKLKPSKGKTG